MTYEDYYTSPVANFNHCVETNGLKVECHTIDCGYEEYFPTYEDAEIGAQVHEDAQVRNDR